MNVDTTQFKSLPALRLKIFGWTFFCTLFVLGVVGWLLTALENRQAVELLKKEQQSVIQQRQQLIGEYFSHVHADLFYLSMQNELTDFLVHKDFSSQQVLGAEYLNFLRPHTSYDQIRFLDLQGQEIARVNNNAGNPSLVPNSQLQNKQHRYYFHRTIVLNPGQIFTSVFDLNLENQQVEIPYKPIIRFATPVTTVRGEKAGVIIINYLGEYLLAAIQQGGSLVPSQLMMLNPQGYWLLHPDENKRWGFTLPGRQDENFSVAYPEAWPQIINDAEGQFETAAGIFTFATVSPPYLAVADQKSRSDVAGQQPEQMRFWKLVSLVPRSRLDSETRRLQIMAGFFVGGLLLLTVLPTWRFAAAIARRSFYHQEIERLAHQDKLTGLTSRALFEDRLVQSFERATRSQGGFALLYLDLDGFKAVNDRFGHDGGDQVLQNVALRMRRLIRRTDTAARVGGDEFCIIIEDLKADESIEDVAKKLLQSLAAPFEVRGREVKISASIGISLFPQHADSPEEMVVKADKAMYAAKHAGKNSYRMVDSK